jgi:hypothetical protein
MSRIDDRTTQVHNLGSKDKFAQLAAGTKNYETLRLGLVGWVSYNFDDGSEVPFKTERDKGLGLDVPTEETLSYLPPEVRNELAEAILNGNSFTAAELGK